MGKSSVPWACSFTRGLLHTKVRSPFCSVWHLDEVFSHSAETGASLLTLRPQVPAGGSSRHNQPLSPARWGRKKSLLPQPGQPPSPRARRRGGAGLAAGPGHEGSAAGHAAPPGADG